jgi:hypothetical protein
MMMSLTSRDEHEMKEFGNRALRRTFETRGG